MPDREKVIRGLECCAVKQNCNGCPYFRFNPMCQDDMNKDALTLLKEQEADNELTFDDWTKWEGR